MRQRITLLSELNGSGLRDAFALADTPERNSLLFSKMLTVQMFQWPLSRFSLFLSQLDKVLPEVEVTNRKITLGEQNSLRDAFVSASIWTDIGGYLKARTLFMQSSLPDNSINFEEFKAFDEVTPSFHFPARFTVIEDGIEVGTVESEDTVFLQSHIDIIDSHRISADLSDTHDAPEECERVAQFNYWFNRQLNNFEPVAVTSRYSPPPSKNL